jgi:hypothetical protein
LGSMGAGAFEQAANKAIESKAGVGHAVNGFMLSPE